MALTYRALALLLTYPSADLKTLGRDAMAAIREEGLLPGTIERSLNRLVDHLMASDLYDLQEAYVQLFDRTRSLSLNLYEHVHGESRDRGPAMVALLELYRGKGLELSANELPDYLPVFLEFLSTLPDAEASSLLGEAAHVLEAMSERLKKRDSWYRSVFAALACLAGDAADQEALAALLQEPDIDPDDLEALDKIWEETVVTFGPEETGCPKADAMLRTMNAEPMAPRRAPAAGGLSL